jgi:branched-chain amino acid transport system substrate-binding protein
MRRRITRRARTLRDPNLAEIRNASTADSGFSQENAVPATAILISPAKSGTYVRTRRWYEDCDGGCANFITQTNMTIRGLESIQRVDLGGLMLSYGERDQTGSEFVEMTMIGKSGHFVC